MSGCIIQLVAYGIEDLYLSSDPQITFFKLIYRRYTNFAIESVVQNFSSSINFGESATCVLSRVGDLVGKIFLYIELPAIPKINGNTSNDHLKLAWVNNIGYAIIGDILLNIGGKIITRNYGEWLYIWSLVSGKQDNARNKMIGNIPSMYTFSDNKEGYKLYVPLEFWFCRNNGLALPIIALAYSDVKLIVTFRKFNNCFRIGPTNSIEIMEDIAPFEPGDYIEQTINGITVQGYVIEYDFITKKLYYIKIYPPTSPRKKFESFQDDQYENYTDFARARKSHNNIPNKNIDYVKLSIPFRIYNSLTGYYCTPMPNKAENIENINLFYEPKIVKSFLYVDYIYLDNSERNNFIKNNLEYLIEQVQFNEIIGINSPNVKQKLSLNHPCKAHYWVIQLDSMVRPGSINDIFNYTMSHESYNSYNENDNIYEHIYYGESILKEAKLELNGHDRFGEKSWEYFNFLEPYISHTRGPKIGINVYSPSLYPEDIQPSSTINMSRIDTIYMIMRLNYLINIYNTARIRSYTINYNILRIIFGTGGIVFI